MARGATGNFRCTSYLRADGTPLISAVAWEVITVTDINSTQLHSFTGLTLHDEYRVVVNFNYATANFPVINFSNGGTSDTTSAYYNARWGVDSAFRSTVSTVDTKWLVRQYPTPSRSQ